MKIGNWLWACPTIVFLFEDSQSVLAQQQKWDLEANFAWDSIYVSEGRDNLEEGGLVSAWAVGAYESWEFGIFAGEGDSVSFGERNYWVARSWRAEEIEFAFAATYLDFTVDDAQDVELSLELGKSLSSESHLSCSLTYSKESDGLFFELSLSREYTRKDGSLLRPFAILSANSGYLSDEPKGLNDMRIGVAYDFRLTEHARLELTANASLGLAEGVVDIVWVGVRFSR